MTDLHQHCALHLALGHEQACPHAACPFWEDGGAAVEPGCAIGRLGLELRRPGLAAYLLEIRTALETVRSREERTAVRATFAQLVPADLAG